MAPINHAQICEGSNKIYRKLLDMLLKFHIKKRNYTMRKSDFIKASPRIKVIVLFT